MRGVRQAVSRCERAGLTVSCHRVADLDDETLATVLTRADQWRDGEVERGFSMALGRFGERARRPVGGGAVPRRRGRAARAAALRARGATTASPWT